MARMSRAEAQTAVDAKLQGRVEAGDLPPAAADALTDSPRKRRALRQREKLIAEHGEGAAPTSGTSMRVLPAGEGDATDRARAAVGPMARDIVADRYPQETEIVYSSEPVDLEVEPTPEAEEAAPAEEPPPEPVPVDPEVAAALDDTAATPESREISHRPASPEELSAAEERRAARLGPEAMERQRRLREYPQGEDFDDKYREAVGRYSELTSTGPTPEGTFAPEEEEFEFEDGTGAAPEATPEATPEAAAPPEGFSMWEPLGGGKTRYQVEGDEGYSYIYDENDDSYTIDQGSATGGGSVIRQGSPFHAALTRQRENPTTYQPNLPTTRAAGLAMADDTWEDEEQQAAAFGELESPVDAGYETVGAEEAAAQELGESLPGTEDPYAVSEDPFPEAAGAEQMGWYEGPEASTVAGTLGTRGGLREAGRAIDARKGAALREAGEEGVEQAHLARGYGDADQFSGKRTVAPSGAVTRNKQLLEEAIQQGGLAYDDLTPEQKGFFNNFKESSFSRRLSPEDRYVVGRLKAMEAVDEAARAAAEAVADEAFDEIDDRVAQSLLTRLQGGLPSLPEGARGAAAYGKEVAGKAARTALGAAEYGVTHPGQMLKGAGRVGLAALSLMPDPTDIAMLAASAPYLGLYELGARKDLENALQGRGPDWPYLYTSERPPSTAHRRQMFDFIDQQRTEEGRASAIKQLIEVTKFVEPEVLSAVIQVESDGAGLTPFDQLPPTERELRGGTAEAARETAPAFSPKL